MKIYYCYAKADGAFQGSGTPFIDNAETGCTEVPAPEYDAETELPYWIGKTWEVRPNEP